MKTNLLVPFVRIDEKTIQFYLNGFLYEKRGSELKVIETTSKKELATAIQIYENFEISNQAVTWYHGKYKFIYNINENVFMWNNSHVLDKAFVKHIQAAGAIHFQDLKKAELFESTPSMLENFVILDNCASFKSSDGRILIDLFVIENKIYAMRYNTQSKLTKFFEEKNPNNMVDYINEQTGESALTFLQNFLEEDMQKKAHIESQLNTLHEMLAYLNDKRQELAEADRSLPEIRKADTVLKSEIENVKLQITEILESNSL